MSAGSPRPGPPPGKVRVLLADDHPVVRAGLRGMLEAEPGIEVTAEASSGPEAVALAARVAVDVVLMDLRMPGGDGVRATEQLSAIAAGPRVVVLTTYDTDADILRAVEAGAVGYLLKDATKQELADAVRAAARGETVLAPAVAGRLVSRLRQGPETAVTGAVGPGNGDPGPRRPRADQRRDRPGAVHQRGDGQDAPAAGLRQARGLGQDGGGRRRDRARPAPPAGRAGWLTTPVPGGGCHRPRSVSTAPAR